MYTNLLDYRPVNDGSTINTEVFQTALSDIGRKGGGTLYIPPGKYLTGSICLQDNTYLYISAGAELIASSNYNDFSCARSEVLAEDSLYGFIFAKDRTNVGIIGPGVINGSAPEYNSEEVDQFGYRKPNAQRIRMCIFENCKNVLVEGITIVDSPMWTLHFISCEYGRIANVNILNGFKYTNTDAIDIDGCRNFHIYGCNLETADDGVCLKTSRKGEDLDRSCENIVVENCIIESYSSALKIGTESHNDFKNIKFSNILILKSNRGIALMPRDGGNIENVTFDNISIENEFKSPCHWGKSDSIYISVRRRSEHVSCGYIKDIYMSNISVKSTGAINLHSEQPDLIRNINMVNVRQDQMGSLNPARGTYDLRPPGNPSRQDDSGVHEYPDGLPAVYIDNITEKEVKFDNCRFTQEEGFSWNPQLIVFNQSC